MSMNTYLRPAHFPHQWKILLEFSAYREMLMLFSCRAHTAP